MARLAIVDRPDRAPRHQRAQRVNRGAVREIHVMDRAQERVDSGARMRAAAKPVSEQREDRRLVKGRKALDAVAVAAGDEGRVVGEPAGRVPDGPATQILERLRQVPMIKAKPRLDAGGQQRIDQPIVERKSGLVDPPPPLRQQPRPGDREPVRLHTQRLHQRDILGIAVVMVAGLVAGVAIGDAASGTAGIPHARAAAVFARRALDLKARCGHPPNKSSGERVAAAPRGCGRRPGMSARMPRARTFAHSDSPLRPLERTEVCKARLH